MAYQVPEDANYNGNTQSSSTSDFVVLPDNTKVTYAIHKAEIRERNLRGTKRKSLSLGLIVKDETGLTNYIWDELYIDQSVWLEKSKSGQPWMLNMYLAFTNSCGIRAQGGRELLDEWFTNANCYISLTGEAVVEKEAYNGEYRNRIKYYNQRKAEAVQPAPMATLIEGAATVETHNPQAFAVPPDEDTTDIPFQFKSKEPLES